MASLLARHAVILPLLVAGSAQAAPPAHVKIAIVAPLSGSSKPFGTTISNGAKLAIDDYAATHPGITAEWRDWDDGSSTETTRQIFDEALAWQADVILGPVETHTTAVAADMPPNIQMKSALCHIASPNRKKPATR